MRDRPAPGRRDRLQCADLVLDVRGETLRRDRQTPPSETAQIVEARMRADRHAAFQRQFHGARHHQRIARVKPAGDVGRGHDTEQRRIVTHGPGAEALAHIGVKIDAGHSASSSAPETAPLINS